MARLRVDMSCRSSISESCRNRTNESTNLGGLVFACGEEVGTVSGELDVVDLVVKFMGLDGLELFTSLLGRYGVLVPNPETRKRTIQRTLPSYWLTPPSS